MKIKTGDKVKVLSGKDRGKEGKVAQIFIKEKKASVEGINLMYKHIRSKQAGQIGQKVQFPAPLSIDKLMVICSKCGKPTRVRMHIGENKKRMRKCRHCQEII